MRGPCRTPKRWTAAELAKLRRLYPDTRTRDIKIVGRNHAEIKIQCSNLYLRKSAAFMASPQARRPWSKAELDQLRQLYPDARTADLVARFARGARGIYAKASQLGLRKSAAFYTDAKKSGRFDKLFRAGARGRFPKGHVPANKGLRRPGWAPGRMRETQFKKGHFPANRDPDFYVLGALRINSDGYIDMRISFEPGAKGWRPLHRILWEDAHGPIPPRHIVTFKNRDKLDVELDNLELITFADNCRRNSVHNLPVPLRDTIQLLGQLRRRINEK